MTNPKVSDLRKAAPEMYEALKDLVKQIEDSAVRWGLPKNQVDTELQDAKQAIAKAEGKC